RRFEGRHDAFRQKARDHRLAAAHVEIKVTHARLELLLDFSHYRSRPSGDQLRVDAKALLENSFDLLSKLGAGRNRNDHFSLFLPGFNDVVPLTLRRLSETQWQMQSNQQKKDNAVFHSSPTGPLLA